MSFVALAGRFPPVASARRCSGGATAACAGLAAAIAAADPAVDDTWFELSGEHRARHETLEGQFRSGFAGDTRALSLRTLLKLEGGRGELRGAFELLDARAYIDDDLPVDATIVNTLEPLELFLGWRREGLLAEGAVSDLRAGIVTIDLGKRRLLARNRFRNTINSFAGIDWHWQLPSGASLRAFTLHPIERRPTDRDALADNTRRRDRIESDRILSGVLYHFQSLPTGIGREAYALRLSEAREIADAQSRDLMTAGLRLYRLPAAGRLDFEIEAMLQRGDSGPRQMLEHDAVFGHAELGYTFTTGWTPRVVVQLDHASGDDDPSDDENGGFDTLFGSRRFDFGPTGILGPVGRGNLNAAALRIELAPTARLGALIAYRGFRLDSSRDAWGTTGIADPSGTSGDSLGRQLDARLVWQAVPGRIDLETGGARLALGRFAQSAPGATGEGDAAYGYAQLTVRF